mmetsp:Transcript_23904/g.59551  ORF Transcript_23904/g.59551 Transcript_23904/m.59551 type:complete len:206 (-) Transcript_23904:345-962(-)
MAESSATDFLVKPAWADARAESGFACITKVQLRTALKKLVRRFPQQVAFLLECCPVQLSLSSLELSTQISNALMQELLLCEAPICPLDTHADGNLEGIDTAGRLRNYIRCTSCLKFTLCFQKRVDISRVRGLVDEYHNDWQVCVQRADALYKMDQLWLWEVCCTQNENSLSPRWNLRGGQSERSTAIHRRCHYMPIPTIYSQGHL